jgi:hypothetical protein
MSDDIVSKFLEISRNIKVQQKSIEWLNERSKYVCASESLSVYRLKDHHINMTEHYNSKKSIPSNRYTKFILAKLEPQNVNRLKNVVAIQHGVAYEPWAIFLRQRRAKSQIVDISFMTSGPVGATPDGFEIHEDGTYNLIEIKCPYSRIVNGSISSDYIFQMQHQMHTTGIHKTIFIDNKITEISYNEFKRNTEIARGTRSADNDINNLIMETYDELIANPDKWLIDNNLKSEDLIWWRLDNFRETEVKYDPLWSEKCIPFFETVHNDLKFCVENPDIKELFKHELMIDE